MIISNTHSQQSTTEVAFEEIVEEEPGDVIPNCHSKRVIEDDGEEVPIRKKRRLDDDEADFDPKDVRKKDGRGRQKKRMTK